MRVVVTGTPGTGKTTATELVDTSDLDETLDVDDVDLDVVHLNDLVKDEVLYSEVDEDRDSVVADLDAVRERLADADGVIVDSHLAHHLDADHVIVLRCHPDVLEDRLTSRGEPEAKAAENADAESLDVILSEAVSQHGLENVYEIDTTDRTPEEVARDIERVISGEREPSAGEVDFMEAR